MSTTHTSFVLFFATVVCLSGCDQLRAFDEVKNGVVADHQRLAELTVTSSDSQQQIVSLRVELGAIKQRLAALEIAQSVSPKAASNDPAVLPSEQAAMLTASITQCVQQVRSIGDTLPKEPFDNAVVYAKFDAFYNVASGRVQNNNQYVDQSAIYAFNKCMSTHGWPLK
ncbi:hypothetical protein [Variovorax sp. LG9.2]|uniref:hypothetical protein n=1 Tax=Variovorax sp. LG9.2 TaxID=3048626 RepID=UPI002B228CB2|nr:hypothetical protein [Variovorax sp. LG9.2]MEB0058802.1 hypothetical protein [Variovorax sp. LG9.2]